MNGSKYGRFGVSLGLFTGTVFIWSAINPHDYFTWFLEVFPVIIGVVVLALTYRKFPLSRLLLALLCIHGAILMLGGHYTYAEVPFGYWIKDAFHLMRNPYDRIGHFAQGFVPAILLRELLLRTSPLKRGGWLFALVTASCLGFSGFYELIEWWVAVATGSAAEAFLGTQGDPWDTQWDMCLALIGAMSSLALLSNTHDASLAKLKESHCL